MIAKFDRPNIDPSDWMFEKNDALIKRHYETFPWLKLADYEPVSLDAPIQQYLVAYIHEPNEASLARIKPVDFRKVFDGTLEHWRIIDDEWYAAGAGIELTKVQGRTNRIYHVNEVKNIYCLSRYPIDDPVSSRTYAPPNPVLTCSIWASDKYWLRVRITERASRYLPHLIEEVLALPISQIN